MSYARGRERTTGIYRERNKYIQHILDAKLQKTHETLTKNTTHNNNVLHKTALIHLYLLIATEQCKLVR